MLKVQLRDEIDDVVEFNEQVGSACSEDSEESPHRGLAAAKPQKTATDAADYCSWSVYGNDNYIASSKTVSQLPAGIYRCSYNPNGQLVYSMMKVVTDDLFRLADSVSIKILESIEHFWNSKELFKKYGMIFKRGIMLYGLPGSGKTVTITLLAQQLIARDGIVFMCQNPAMINAALQNVRRIEPNRPIVNIIEDIDSVIDEWGESDILALLDGENQVDNIVHVASTNYPERLDARIVNRPSRFDEIRKIDMPNPSVRSEYIKSVLEGKGEIDDATLAKWVADSEGLSLAHLRELVVAIKCLERNYEPTITRLKKMQATRPKSGNGSSVGFKKSRQVAGLGDPYEEPDEAENY